MEEIKSVNEIDRSQQNKVDSTYPTHIGIYNIDQCILYYMKNVILPKIIWQNEILNIPILYGNAERWEQIRKHNYVRDANGKIMFPLIVYRRNGLEKNNDLPFKKIQGENPQFFRSLGSNPRNQRFTNNLKNMDNLLMNPYYKPEMNDNINIIMPDYVKVSYNLVIITNYIEQMNYIIEMLNFYADTYWGNDYFKFKTIIPSFDDQIEFSSDGARLIKSECNLSVDGYIIPDMHTIKPIVTKEVSAMKVNVSEKII